MAEKEYIKLKRRVVYRGEVYNALEAERIKALGNISKPYYDGYCDGLKKAIQILANDIEDIPAADVRPVVLCRDCDCWNDWDHAGRESLGNYVCSCAYWSVEDGPVFYTRPTDFCSYGERREES